MDLYNLKARVFPAVIVSLPLAVAMNLLLPTEVVAMAWIGTGVVWAATSYLIAQVVRERGLAIQERLFREWGGEPTTTMLRFLPGGGTKVKARRESLSRLFPELRWPSLEEETSNPLAFQATAERAIALFKEKTEGQGRFELLLQENTDYGFRRNLFGLKSVAIWFAIIGAASGGYFLADAQRRDSPAGWIAFFAGILVFFFFAGVVTSEWVRKAADRYARQLFAIAESLASGSS